MLKHFVAPIRTFAHRKPSVEKAEDRTDGGAIVGDEQNDPLSIFEVRHFRHIQARITNGTAEELQGYRIASVTFVDLLNAQGDERYDALFTIDISPFTALGDDLPGENQLRGIHQRFETRRNYRGRLKRRREHQRDAGTKKRARLAKLHSFKQAHNQILHAGMLPRTFNYFAGWVG